MTMGTLIGHVLPGIGFLLVGLWHLFNHTKQFLTNAEKYISLIWFPTSSCRHMELYTIMFGCTCFIVTELVISPTRHTTLNADGTIPSYHLRNIENSTIAFTSIAYTITALAFDKLVSPIHLASHHNKIVQFFCGVAFAQQFLIFHSHSTNHIDIESQYHSLLKLIVAVAFGTTQLGIAWPRSFVISFIRSLSVAFEGIWLVVTGFMLWTSKFMPKGCYVILEDGRHVLRCNGDNALNRAKSLINIGFCLLLTCIVMFGVLFYVLMIRLYGFGTEYELVVQEEDVGDEVAQCKNKSLPETTSFDHSRDSFEDMEM